MRSRIVAGNWKMNKDLGEGIELVREIIATSRSVMNVTIVLAPPFPLLKDVFELIREMDHVKLAGQNCHEETVGAFTGEISASMLASVGCDYVITGHSERRKIFGESGAAIALKSDRILENGMSPIFCCGESLEEREAGAHFETVDQQIRESLFHLGNGEMERVIIAYEPVWAIGTGRTASPGQAQEMHAHIRDLINIQYGEDLAEGMSLLYGGSCKPDNAREIFSQPDVDGGLIGGASLHASDFYAICHSFDE